MLHVLSRGMFRQPERYHARSIEWYSSDDSNPSFQPYLAQWQKDVDK